MEETSSAHAMMVNAPSVRRIVALNVQPVRTAGYRDVPMVHLQSRLKAVHWVHPSEEKRKR